MSETDIDAILRGGKSRRGWLLLAGAAVVVAAVVIAVFLLTRAGETDVVFEPERTEAVMGQLTTEVDLSGSALSERSATLSFEVAGVVASLEVSRGDEVRQGDSLASLDDTEAQRRVETAQIQLGLAQLRLEDLLAGPEPSAIASANQALASANSQVIGAEQALALLSEPPSASDLASAEQAVASALREISSAEQELALLSEPPGAADLASAEQAVASALREVSSAQQALTLLSEPPSASDLRSAEQAVATALREISNSEQALSDLTTDPSEAVVSEARSAVTQAQVQLADATRLEEELNEILTTAAEDFCERYSGLIPSDEVIRSICTAILPLSDTEVDALQDSFEDRSATYESLGLAFIEANLTFVAAAADRDSALSTLRSSEETLAELLKPVSEDDLYQAQQAVEAARASHAAAVARLEDLQTLAGEDDVYQAEQAVEAAMASHTAAVSRLGELQTKAGEDDVYQAEQAVEAAKASHTAAVARLEELRAATDEGEFEQARASLESARASLTSAQAQYDELVTGPSENAIEQQRQDLRLAELTMEEARAALDDLSVIAPFDGVVEVVNILPGDRIDSGSPAFTLSTTNRMLIALTVTEEELPDLEVGQTGLATFDAIDGTEYPIRVDSIIRVPNSEQGVVTYDVEARILTAGAGAAGGFRPGGPGTGAGFVPGGGIGGGASRALLAGLELPEGVTIQQVIQAVANGEPLPEGVVLPEEFEEAAQAFRQFAGSGQGRRPQQASGGAQGTANQPGTVVDRPLPAPGMSASVTILTEVREPAVLVPVSAVRQLDGSWFVSVSATSEAAEAEAEDEAEDEVGFERVFVEVGDSDGTNVEILSSIDSGTILLIGADNAGIAFSATLQQPQANPGFGFGPGGGRR